MQQYTGVHLRKKKQSCHSLCLSKQPSYKTIFCILNGRVVTKETHWVGEPCMHIIKRICIKSITFKVIIIVPAVDNHSNFGISNLLYPLNHREKRLNGIA